MNNKQRKRLEELNNAGFNKTHEEFMERAELEFIRNKQNINFRLSGNDKYYNASQCNLFVKNIKQHGFYNTPMKEILEKGISFNKHSINVGGQYSRDIKRFNNTTEHLGFVVGFNEACSVFDYNETANREVS